MAGVNKFKNTIYGKLPAEWRLERLDDLFKFLPTHSFSRENLTQSPTANGIQNIHYGDIHSTFESEVLDCSDYEIPFIKDEMISNQKFHFIKDGDLIIADASEDYDGVGECVEIKNVQDKKVIAGLHTFLLRDFSAETVPGFRTYMFRNPKVTTELKKIATGTSVFSVSITNLKKLLVPVPSKAEQQKIAEILSTWDEGISKTSKILSELELRKTALRINLFSGKKWKVFPLTKLLTRIKKPVIVENEIMYRQIGIRSHAKGIFNKEPVSGASLGSKSVFHVEPDCFVVNIVFAWEHAVAKTTQGEVGMIASHRFPMFKPLPGKLDLDYLLHFFKTSKGKDLLRLASPGGAGRNKTLGQSEFLKLAIPVPKIDDQRKIAKCLDAIDEQITLFRQRLIVLQKQKRGLMQQLLTGKVRVK
jgi:type I restriction enzyme S subunit